MTSIAVSGVASPTVQQATSASKTAPVESTATTTQAQATLKADTVHLTPSARAKMLHQQGQNPAQIASTLGTTVATVDGYLNIKVAVPATQAAATTSTTASARNS